jgi:hypothetical protein
MTIKAICIKALKAYSVSNEYEFIFKKFKIYEIIDLSSDHYRITDEANIPFVISLKNLKEYFLIIR